ncbi:MAG: dihydrofolate reductase [Candidatus Absconditabacteria bacterium]|nr:dihydrofolate reductase [Candidatus Absconditabacteria bacterium]
MKINIIAGMAKNRVIGKNNTLPRHYSEDLQHFKRITTGNIIVMGYNTYLSLGRQLPNRRNIVLSKEPIQGVEYYTSIPALMEKLESEGVSEFFVIGGAFVYQQFIDQADILYLTEIKKEYDGDTFFPAFEDKFVEVSREVGEELDFVVYKKLER